MRLSPSTVTFAARGLGDRLLEAGVAAAALDFDDDDTLFMDTVREQMAFRAGPAAPARTREAALLSLAVAHAVGRMTAAVHSVVEDVEKAWPRLDGVTRSEICRVIRAAEGQNRLGMECDARRWRDVLALAPEEAEADGQEGPRP